MAKRGTLEHPKTKRLARQLGMPAWSALGLLEAVWHWVGRYRPNGFLTADDMADCADTLRCESGEWLIDHLCNSGHLDGVENGFYIHDWHMHADDSVRKVLELREELFANGSAIRRPRKEAPKRAKKEPKKATSRMDRETNENDSRNDLEKSAIDSRQPKPKPKPIEIPPSGVGPTEPDAPALDPYRATERVLTLIAEVWDVAEPTREDVTRWLAPSTPLAKLLKKHPPDTVAGMFLHEAKFKKSLTWAEVLTHEMQILRNMRASTAPPPPPEGRRTPVVGKDFHLGRDGEGNMRKFEIVGGVKTDRPFDADRWAQAQGVAAA